MKNKDEVINRISIGLSTSGFNIIDIKMLDNTIVLFEIHKIRTYRIYMIIRNIGKSGWSDKPHIRRVQVGKIDVSTLIPSSDTNTSLIMGVQELFDRDIFVAWDVYKYGNHKTNRSCYVKVANIFKGFMTGYFSTTDSNQKIWISDPYHLDQLLNDYLKFNWISLGD